MKKGLVIKGNCWGGLNNWCFLWAPLGFHVGNNVIWGDFFTCNLYKAAVAFL